jgi:hypothetical protein
MLSASVLLLDLLLVSVTQVLLWLGDSTLCCSQRLFMMMHWPAAACAESAMIADQCVEPVSKAEGFSGFNSRLLGVARVVATAGML